MSDRSLLWICGWNTQGYETVEMSDRGFTYKSFIAWDTIQGSGGGLWVNRQENKAIKHRDRDRTKIHRNCKTAVWGGGIGGNFAL